eukprot:1157996-Pelagomonas_calceolata.AAC.8
MQSHSKLTLRFVGAHPSAQGSVSTLSVQSHSGLTLHFVSARPRKAQPAFCQCHPRLSLSLSLDTLSTLSVHGHARLNLHFVSAQPQKAQAPFFMACIQTYFVSSNLLGIREQSTKTPPQGIAKSGPCLFLREALPGRVQLESHSDTIRTESPIYSAQLTMHGYPMHCHPIHSAQLTMHSYPMHCHPIHSAQLTMHSYPMHCHPIHNAQFSSNLPSN